MWSLAAIIASAGCGGATETLVGPSGGTGGRCQITLTTPTLPSAGAQLSTHLTTTRDCAWSAQSDADWLTMEPATGQGEATVVLAAVQNPAGRPRTAALMINDQRFTVTQDASPCRFDVVPRTLTVPSSGGRLAIQVTTLDGCAWSTQSSQAWMRVISGSGGDSSHLLEVAVDSNPDDDRSAQLAVAGATVDVRQARASTGPSCDYSMDPGALPLFPATGGSGRATVHVGVNCHWHARSTQSWVVLLSNANGRGLDDIVYRVEPNPSRSQRSAEITVGTVRHVVNQRGSN